ncbi:MAG TPA: circularly permuted type 2 ATP-grasp protein [Chloroflexota bacterium]
MTTADVGRTVATYHSLLATDLRLAEDSAAMLHDEQPDLLLTFGGKPLCTVLRPQFFAPDTYRAIQAGCRLLASAMFRLAQRILADPELLALLHLSSEERDLVTVDPGFSVPTPTTRLDSFMANTSWRFVEYNAETPAAIAYEDLLGRLFLRLPVMREFARSHRLTSLTFRERLRDTLLNTYHEWGGRETPTIAIVDWPDLPTATEHELFCRHFAEAGLGAVIAQPSELEYDGRRLSVRGQSIDIVYRRVLTSELLARPDLAGPLVQAYKDRRVCVINSFRSKLLHKKAIFALLSDERYAHFFGEDERRAIALHIPWTRVVSDRSTTYNGREVDLLEFIAGQQERLVMKPNDEYGGKGVVIGWETPDHEWQRAIRDALEKPFVVQERVPIDREQFPVWVDGQLDWPQLSADLDPYLFGTEVDGVLVRLSAAGLLNVTAGTGTLAPAFVVEPV